MNLLGKFLQFIAQAVLRVLTWLFVQLVRILIPIILSLLRRLANLMLMTFEATITGPRKYIERLSSEWTQRFIGMGISLDLIDTAHRVSRVLATSTIVLGWVIAAFFMVLIVRVVFGYFI